MQAILNTAINYCRENILFIGVTLFVLITLYFFVSEKAEAAQSNSVPVPFEAEDQSYDFEIGISEDKFIHAYTIVEYN